jgi:hypothetical protein
VWRGLTELDPVAMGVRSPDCEVLGLQICERFLNEEEVMVFVLSLALFNWMFVAYAIPLFQT